MFQISISDRNSSQVPEINQQTLSLTYLEDGKNLNAKLSREIGLGFTWSLLLRYKTIACSVSRRELEVWTQVPLELIELFFHSIVALFLFSAKECF